MNCKRVFLVDDDASVLNGLSRLLRQAGFDVQSYQSPSEFLDHHDAKSPGCAILDVLLGDRSGLEIQYALAARGDKRPVIFITGGGDVATGIRAMKAGAFEFVTKPIQLEAVALTIKKALEFQRLRQENVLLRKTVREKFAFTQLIGTSDEMQALQAFIEKAALASLHGDVFDDAATGQGLLNYFLRAINCGALTEDEALKLSSLTNDELRSGSFVKILKNRQNL